MFSQVPKPMVPHPRRPHHAEIRAPAGSALNGRGEPKRAATVLANERRDKGHFGHLLEEKAASSSSPVLPCLVGLLSLQYTGSRLYQLLQHLMHTLVFPHITASCTQDHLTTWDFSPRLP